MKSVMENRSRNIEMKFLKHFDMHRIALSRMHQRNWKSSAILFVAKTKDLS